MYFLLFLSLELELLFLVGIAVDIVGFPPFLVLLWLCFLYSHPVAEEEEQAGADGGKRCCCRFCFAHSSCCFCSSANC